MRTRFIIITYSGNQILSSLDSHDLLSESSEHECVKMCSVMTWWIQSCSRRKFLHNLITSVFHCEKDDQLTPPTLSMRFGGTNRKMILWVFVDSLSQPAVLIKFQGEIRDCFGCHPVIASRATLGPRHGCHAPRLSDQLRHPVLAAK